MKSAYELTKARVLPKADAIICAVSFILTFCLLMAVFMLRSYAPFGDGSLALFDGNTQYMDFMAYFRDVLTGKNSLWYTFSSGLGGSGIGIYSYYLSSPLNLALAFISREQIPFFYDMSVAVKLSLSALTFSWYLQYRFQRKIASVFVICLSLGYGLMAYNLQQAMNLIWLDGVYMLPLMMGGIYRIVHTGGIKLLAIATALSLLFNWYTGALNCIFSAFWLLAETALYKVEKNGHSITLSKILIRYTYGMAAGLLLTGILLLPVLFQLRQGVASSFNFKEFNWGFRGNLLLSLGSFLVSQEGNKATESLYCGALPIIGLIGLFLESNTSKKYKILMAVLLVFAFLMYHWYPLFFLFSMFKPALTFHPRYAYLGTFIVLFCAASFFSIWDGRKFGNKWILLIFLYMIFLYVVNIIVYPDQRYAWTPLNVYITVLILALITLVIRAYSKKIKKNTKKSLTVFFVIIGCAFDLGIEANRMCATFGSFEIQAFNEYGEQEEEQIWRLKKYDPGIYRVSQTEGRNDRNELGIHNSWINYDEPLAFNYWGIHEYTSFPRNNQLQFLDHLGYSTALERMNLVNTSILPADSLLGVKYVLSPYPIKGLKEIDFLGILNNKRVYENPFALPLAFVVRSPRENSFHSSHDSGNPFLFVNEAYSDLLNQDIKIFTPIIFKKSVNDDGILEYKMDAPKGDKVLYGDVEWDRFYMGEIYEFINGVYTLQYENWLSQNLFHIPQGATERGIIIKLKIPSEIPIYHERFYAADLDVLESAVQKIRENKAKNITIKNGEITGNVEGKNGDYLYVSVPYDQGWQIRRNGVSVQPEIFRGCMMMIPLENGINNIQMNYYIPGLKVGVVLLVIGVMLLILSERNRRVKNILE